MEHTAFAATAYQASLSRRELVVELSFRVRDLLVKDKNRPGAALLSAFRRKPAGESGSKEASSLLKVFASKRQEGGDGFGFLGGSDYIEVYSSEIQAPNDSPNYSTTLLLDIPRSENLAVPVGIHLRVELYVSTKTSSSARKFVLYGQASMSLTEIFQRCGYTEYDPLTSTKTNQKDQSTSARNEKLLLSSGKVSRKGWGAWPMETSEHSLCILDIRVAKPPRLLSLEVPNYAQQTEPIADKLEVFPWRSKPPIHPSLLVGFVHAPISRAFTVPMSTDEDNNWHAGRIHRGSSHSRLSVRSRLSSVYSLGAGTGGGKKVLPTNFVEFREEMGELPMGLLIPSLYLTARAAEISKAISEFKAEVRIECAMLSQQLPRNRLPTNNTTPGSPKSSTSRGPTRVSDVASFSAEEDPETQLEIALGKHNAWAEKIVEKWKTRQKELLDIASYYKALWKNCTVGDNHSSRSSTRRSAKSTGSGSRRHQSTASNSSTSSQHRRRTRSNRTGTAYTDRSASAKSGMMRESASMGSSVSNMLTDSVGGSGDLITSLRHTSSRLAMQPDAPVFIDAFMGGGGGADFTGEASIPEAAPSTRRASTQRLSIRRHRRRGNNNGDEKSTQTHSDKVPDTSKDKDSKTKAEEDKEAKFGGVFDEDVPLDITFRSSTTRQNWRLKHLPVNLHLQVLAVHHTNVQMASGSGFYSSRNVSNTEDDRTGKLSKRKTLLNIVRRRGLNATDKDFVNVPAEQNLDAPDESDTEVFSEPVKILPRGSLRPVSMSRGGDGKVTTVKLANGDEEESDSNKSPFATYYDYITVGATTAHHLGFDHGGLSGVLEHESAMRDLWHRMRDDSTGQPGTKLEAARRWHETQFNYMERQDTVYPQALAAVTAAVVSRLHVMAAYRDKTSKSGEDVVEDEETEEHETILEHGFLVGWESLLSTRGKERGMLQDLSSAVDWLTENVQFRLVQAHEGALAIDSSLNRIRLKSSKSVFTGAQAFQGTATAPWLVTIRIPKAIVRQLPPTLKDYVVRSSAAHPKYVQEPGSRAKMLDMESLEAANVKPIRVTCLLFTQGINETQSLANAMASMQSNPADTIQEQINLRSCQALADYCSHRFRSYQPVGGSFSGALNFNRGFREESPRGKSFSIMNDYAAPQDDMFYARQAQAQRSMFLLANLRNAVRQQTSTVKNLKILGLSGDLVRWLNGIRLCSCKSAKDRTSMSITLEEARMLVGLHGVRKEDLLPVANVMREHGVRLINVYKNTKSPKYAFNGLQRAMLPLEYKPPGNTIGSLFRRGNAT